MEDRGTWCAVLRKDVPKDIEIIPLAWIMKIKVLPNGSLDCYKARICARGDLQVSDGSSTCAPVVKWAAIHFTACNCSRITSKGKVVRSPCPHHLLHSLSHWNRPRTLLYSACPLRWECILCLWMPHMKNWAVRQLLSFTFRDAIMCQQDWKCSSGFQSTSLQNLTMFSFAILFTTDRLELAVLIPCR